MSFSEPSKRTCSRRCPYFASHLPLSRSRPSSFTKRASTDETPGGACPPGGGVEQAFRSAVVSFPEAVGTVQRDRNRDDLDRSPNSATIVSIRGYRRAS